jgi:3-oxoacyl-[acyl-carrier protein] reductase
MHGAGLIGSDFEKHAVAYILLGRTGQPRDITSVAVFLASDGSTWPSEKLIATGGSDDSRLNRMPQAFAPAEVRT